MTASRWGCVVLTMGRRPHGLADALGSLLRQRGVELDVVVVGNGWAPEGLPPGVRGLALPENVGIPAGRNAGVDAVTGDLMLFLDDDAALRDDDTLARLADGFAAEPGLGLVQPRVLDPDGLPAPRRWVPRLVVGDPAHSSDVTAVWEGAVAVRRSAFEAAGRWPAEFWYAHEGIDLAWGVWDAGGTVRYRADVVALHEANDPGRQPELHRLAGRNRVWLARRRLPQPLAVVYPLVWLALTLGRSRDLGAVWRTLLGYAQGLAHPPELRRPMSWRTVWRMTRTGRPPVI